MGSTRRSLQPPADCEERTSIDALFQFALYLGDQLCPLLIDLVLRIEQSSALGRSFCLERLDSLLAGKLFIERRCNRSGAASFLDLPVQLFQFAFQPDLTFVGPAIELIGLHLEKSGVPLRDAAANAILLRRELSCELRLNCAWQSTRRTNMCSNGEQARRCFVA